MNKAHPPLYWRIKKIKMNRDIEVLGVFRIHLLLRHFITRELLAIFFYFACQDFIGMGLSPPLFYMMLHAFFLYIKRRILYLFDSNHFLLLAKNNYTF